MLLEQYIESKRGDDQPRGKKRANSQNLTEDCMCHYKNNERSLIDRDLVLSVKSCHKCHTPVSPIWYTDISRGFFNCLNC